MSCKGNVRRKRRLPDPVVDELPENIVPVPGFPGYSVSEHGDLYSCKYGGWRKLKPWLSNKGYRCFQLVDKGRRMRIQAHRLVMLAYIGPCPRTLEVRHLDGDKLNNHLSNLVYGTHKENMLDMVRHGTSRATIGEDHVMAIRAMAKLELLAPHIARSLGLSLDIVSNVMSGRTWSHISQ